MRTAVSRHFQVEGSVQECSHGIWTALAKSQMARTDGQQSQETAVTGARQELSSLGDIQTDQFWGKMPRFGESEGEGSSGQDVKNVEPGLHRLQVLQKVLMHLKLRTADALSTSRYKPQCASTTTSRRSWSPGNTGRTGRASALILHAVRSLGLL